jgi:tetratricopeptide (TPR) repeat protein
MSLNQHLSTLEASGLIRLAAVQPELEYLFRHALVQEAAYASLVKADRKRLHLVVGEALERLYPDQLASRELAPVLAQHFYLAGEGERALRYFTLAGDAAARVYANAEAEMHYARAIEIAKREHLQSPNHPIAQSSNLLISNLYLHRGRALELNAQYDDALANYIEMETLARERGDRALQLAALMQRTTIHSTSTPKFDFALGEQLLAQCLELAQTLNDRAAEARILWNRMNLYRFSGHIPQSLECGERALALAREVGAREQLAFILNDMTHIYVGSRQPGLWQATLSEATALWRELDNRPMLADSLATASLYATMTGSYAEAIAASEEAFALSQTINNAWGKSYSLSFVGRAYWDRGDINRALEVMKEAVRWGEISGFVVAQTQTLADLANVYGSLGALEIALKHVRQAARAAEARIPIFQAYALVVEAELYLSLGDFSRAADSLAQAERLSRANPHPLAALRLTQGQAHLALAQGQYAKVLEMSENAVSELRAIGFTPFVPEALYLRGLALMKTNQPEAGEAALREARAVAEALGARRALWPVLAALAETEAGRGNTTEAQTLRQQARELIQYIADHCPPELRASFLSLPEVRAVLDSIPDQ